MKRFYKEARAAGCDLGHIVQLDGRPLKTQGGQPQVVPSAALAGAMAAEWAMQGEEIDPAHFAFRDLADYALDVVTADPDAVIDKLMRYAETDTLCYRADPDEPLFRRQQEVWEPLLSAFEEREGVAMVRVSGIVHRPQAPEALAALRRRLAALDPFTLAALEQTTTLAHSLALGLSALEQDSDGEALWNAANLEEDWQAELWGEDTEAAQRRARRKESFLCAIAFSRAARQV